MPKSLSYFVLAALALGLLLGAQVQAANDPFWFGAVDIVKAFGGLWLNALRMTVIPLVVALLITGVASMADTAKTGGLVLRFVVLFTVLLFGAALYSVTLVQYWLTLWPVNPADAAAFIASVSGQSAEVQAPTFAQWLQSLAPSNPVKAAAEDAVLPLVVFSLFFGFAATRIAAPLRESIISFFTAVQDTMIVVVQWVLLAGPIGVFALALGVGAEAGLGAAGVLIHYVIVVASTIAGITLVGILLALTFGRQPIGRYFAATAPVWAIAMSTQSSIASLPAMLEATREGLRLPHRVTDVILPLAVAVFRFTSPVGNLAVVLFAAHLYGMELSLLQIVSGIVVAYGVSIGAVGLPGQVSFITSVAPICIAMGVPIDLLGILIAVEIVPDIFRTLGNCAGDVAVTTILADKEEPEASA